MIQNPIYTAGSDEVPGEREANLCDRCEEAGDPDEFRSADGKNWYCPDCFETIDKEYTLQTQARVRVRLEAISKEWAEDDLCAALCEIEEKYGIKLDLESREMEEANDYR